MSRNIQDIEGVGEKFAEQLKVAGISTTDELLNQCGSKKGRQLISSQTGISEKLVLKWVNMSDLFRIKGVAGQYAELLEAAGVDTVKELKMRNAENLADKMKAVNAEKKLVRQVPSLSKVNEWIEQAKVLDPRVTH